MSAKPWELVIDRVYGLINRFLSQFPGSLDCLVPRQLRGDEFNKTKINENHFVW